MCLVLQQTSYALTWMIFYVKYDDSNTTITIISGEQINYLQLCCFLLLQICL